MGQFSETLIVCRDGKHRNLFKTGLSRFTVAAPGDDLGLLKFKRVVLCTGLTNEDTSPKADMHLAHWLETQVLPRLSMEADNDRPA